ncbi:aconitase family protein, partial [uncultured Caballeronia sp.]|uniref:aconitase family protein n=1 Tax=uncultured Caballeronia sp. TaxID=1827198 RepID=UPI0035C9461D
SVYPVAMLSGNRNFPGRIHPDLDLGFIMSPPLVIAFALAGDAEVDLSQDPVQITADGKPVFLNDLWPSREEVAALVKQGVEPSDYPRAFAIASQNPLWHEMKAPESAQYPWDHASTALRRPPFASLSEGSQLGTYIAYPLLVLGDDVTTDHISPASAIPKDSYVADFLVERGDDRNDLNVFASRRGNWEVMLRAAFYNKTLVNLLKADAPTANTLHVPTGEVLPIFEAANRYRADGDSVVLIAGERYGTGSSRDWAAKGQRLLGIRAVLAVSFERIHRSNLIGMGILPLRLPEGITPASLNVRPGDKLEISASAETLAPRCLIGVKIVRVDGKIDQFEATAAVETQLETALLRAGGVIPLILQKTLAAQSLPT